MSQPCFSWDMLPVWWHIQAAWLYKYHVTEQLECKPASGFSCIARQILLWQAAHLWHLHLSYASVFLQVCPLPKEICPAIPLKKVFLPQLLHCISLRIQNLDSLLRACSVLCYGHARAMFHIGFISFPLFFFYCITQKEILYLSHWKCHVFYFEMFQNICNNLKMQQTI